MLLRKYAALQESLKTVAPKQFLLFSLKTYTLQYYGLSQYIILVRHKVIWRHPAAEHITWDLKNGSLS